MNKNHIEPPSTQRRIHPVDPETTWQWEGSGESFSSKPRAMFAWEPGLFVLKSMSWIRYPTPGRGLRLEVTNEETWTADQVADELQELWKILEKGVSDRWAHKGHRGL